MLISLMTLQNRLLVAYWNTYAKTGQYLAHKDVFLRSALTSQGMAEQLCNDPQRQRNRKGNLILSMT
ncbi:hypothetical protein Ngar_c01370 [Candidatus Nitrososphaera gargensis Ga9.2]|uniref:Uncharacterized protein n=1 Tax=Nitrososphaera gargensis (strain Ga9.2) TaxID=1237085 RepID=K0IGY7_NITGG|nr:hypothetical protein Ngar_c01370 [Candidatus Nitrososphaera gargensis Ga9.2]